jgi:hypothetical protein
MDRVYQALRNANAAGDTAAVKALANYIKSTSQSAVEPIEVDLTPTESTMMGEVGRGLEMLLSSARTPFEAMFTSPEEAALAATERSEKIARAYGESPISLARLGRIKDEEGWLSAIAEGISEIPEAVTGQLPQMGATLGAARLGAMAGSPLGGLPGAIIGGGLGALASLVPQFTGYNMERQAETQLAEDPNRPLDIDMKKALSTAVLQSAPELIGQYFILGKNLIRGTLALPREQQAAKLLADATTSYRSAVSGTAVRGAAGEMPTEVAQQVLERWQAGLDLTSDDAISEYGEAALLAGVVGGVLGGGSGAVDTASARVQQAAIDQQKQNEIDRVEAEQRANAIQARMAEGLKGIPATKEGTEAWATDILGVKVNSGDDKGKGRSQLLKVLDAMAGADFNDPVQAAKVRDALDTYAQTTTNKTHMAAIHNFLKDARFANAPKTTTTAPPAGTAAGTPPPAGEAKTAPTGSEIDEIQETLNKEDAAKAAAGATEEMTDEEIEALLKQAGDAEGAGQVVDEDEDEEATAAPAQPKNTVNAVWANKDVDQPIFVYNEPAQPPGEDGRTYSRVRAPNAQRDSFVPTEEIKGWVPPQAQGGQGVVKPATTTAAPAAPTVAPTGFKKEEATFTEPADEGTMYTPEASIKRGNATYSTTGTGTSVVFDTPQPSKGALTVQAVTAGVDRVAGDVVSILANSGRAEDIKVGITKQYLEINSFKTGKFVRLDRANSATPADIKAARNALGDAAVDAFLEGGDEVVTNTATAFLGVDLGKPFNEIAGIFSEHYSGASDSATTTAAPAAPTVAPTEFKLTTADLSALGVNAAALSSKRFKNFSAPETTNEARAQALEEYFALDPVKLNTSPEQQAAAAEAIGKLRGAAPVSGEPTVTKTETKKKAKGDTKKENKGADKQKAPKKPRKGKAAKSTANAKRAALMEMGFSSAEIDEMSVSTQDTYLDLEGSKNILLPDGKFILPHLQDNKRIRESYAIDKDGKKAITALTDANPLDKLEQKIERQEKLTPEELAAWYFHTYEPASAIIVMESEAASEIDTSEADVEGNLKVLTQPERLGIKTSGRSEDQINREAVANISEALEWLNDHFAPNTQLQLVRAKARASVYEMAKELLSRYTSRRKTDSEVAAMHLLSGFGRSVGVGDFYVGMGINSTFDPSMSSDEVVERNDKVDKKIYKKPGEVENAVDEGAEVATEDALLTEVSSFKALKEAITDSLEEGETLEKVLKAMGIKTAKQFQTARTAALQRKGNLSKEEADEVAAVGTLTSAIDDVPAPTFMDAEQKKAQEDDIAAQVQEYLRYNRIQEIAPGVGGREGTLDPKKAGSRAQVRSYLRTPKFRGPDFNKTIRAAVEKGNIRAAINELIKTNSNNPELVQLLRKLLPVVANTKIVLDGGIPLFHSGMYLPGTDTVHLDSISGMNEHTLLHEIFHAGLARIVGDPDNALSEQWQKLFSAVKTQLGDAYGGTDMQEFGAELGGNPEFQALLKTIKAPRGGNFLNRVWQMLLEAVGIRKRATAYDKAMQLANDILDISVGLDPLPGEAMYLGGGIEDTVAYGITSRQPGTTEEIRNRWDRLKAPAAETLMKFASLTNMYALVKGTPLEEPFLYLEKLVQQKRGEQDAMIDEAGKKLEELAKVEGDPKFAAAMKRMSALAIDIRRAGVEIVDLPEYDATGAVVGTKKFKPNAKQKEAFAELQKRFNALPKEVRDAYTTIRTELDKYLADYIRLMEPFFQKTQEDKDLLAALRRSTGYIPFMRDGDYWYTFKDPQTGEYSALAEQSAAERDRAIAALKKEYPELRAEGAIKLRDSLEQVLRSGESPAVELMAKIKKTLKDNGASAELIGDVESDFITLFPQKSLIQHFRPAKMYPGMQIDPVRGYADQAQRWIHRISSLKYNMAIREALKEVEDAHEASGSETQKALVNTLKSNIDFALNPTVPQWSTMFTYGSYLEYILGSLSAAAVNLSGLLTQVPAMLSAQYGVRTFSVLKEAAKNPTKKMTEKGGRYEALYKEMEGRGLRKHPLSREVTQRGKQSLADYNTLFSKSVDFLSKPFTWSEQYMREVTAIAAYDLARAGGGPMNAKPMSVEEAIEYALRVVQDAHTAGMAETAPRIMQHPVGRVIFTFKQIVFAQAFYLAKNYHKWLIDSKATPEEKRFARRYLLAVHGYSFALLGAKGLPFMGAYMMLSRLLEILIPDDREEDEPYDPRQSANDVFGDFFYNGLVANLLKVDISERAALANDVLFRDDPQSIREYGLVRTIMSNMFGPLGSYGISVGTALSDWSDGGSGYKAVEAVVPAFARNGMRGYRYYMEGVTTRTGSPVVEDIDMWQAATQSIGFAPAEVSQLYQKRASAKAYEQALLDRKSRILDKYYASKLAGDSELMREAQREAGEFMRSHPQLMNSSTLERSYKSRIAAEEEKIAGLRFSKGLLPEIQAEYFTD